MEATYVIDTTRMNNVLRKLRFNIRWNELMEEYVNYTPSFSPKLFNEMNSAQLVWFRGVFHFKKSDALGARKELSNYVRNYPEFYGDSLEEVYAKMCGVLKYFNEVHRTQFPFVNWLPDYGGLLQPPQHGDAQQIDFMRQHAIPYLMTGQVPGEERNDE